MLKEYLISLVGVGVLSVIIHLVLPEGKVSKVVLFSFSLFAFLVIISPILDISQSIDFPTYEWGEEETYSDEDSLKDQIEAQFAGAKVNLVKNATLEYIFVDLSELVIFDNAEHINYYTAIKDFVKQIVEIDEERIVVYG